MTRTQGYENLEKVIFGNCRNCANILQHIRKMYGTFVWVGFALGWFGFVWGWLWIGLVLGLCLVLCLFWVGLGLLWVAIGNRQQAIGNRQ